MNALPWIGPPARMVVADPGWQSRDNLPGATRGAASNYRTQPTTEIMRQRLPPIADDAILLLWRLASMQKDALQVGHAWGFGDEPKAEFVWRKLTKNGKRWFGMGHYSRGEHETCLLWVRGRPKILLRNIRSTFEAPAPTYWEGHPDVGKVIVCQRGKNKGKERVIKVGDYIHSAKPDVFQTEICERLGEGPRLELYARRPLPGWVCLGDQLPSR